MAVMVVTHIYLEQESQLIRHQAILMQTQSQRLEAVAVLQMVVVLVVKMEDQEVVRKVVTLQQVVLVTLLQLAHLKETMVVMD
jgi:hypothetical protein